MVTSTIKLYNYIIKYFPDPIYFICVFIVLIYCLRVRACWRAIVRVYKGACVRGGSVHLRITAHWCAEIDPSIAIWLSRKIC